MNIHNPNRAELQAALQHVSFATLVGSTNVELARRVLNDRFNRRPGTDENRVAGMVNTLLANLVSVRDPPPRASQWAGGLRLDFQRPKDLSAQRRGPNDVRSRRRKSSETCARRSRTVARPR